MDEFQSHSPPASSATGVGFFRMKKLKGQGIIKRAARHNRREIQAELGGTENIDPNLTSQNEILCGPPAADEVPQLARRLMAEAGVSITRHDAVHAVELVFSLPLNIAFEDRLYFVDCVMWVAQWFGGAGNILSADIHRDESQIHCHVLVLPILNGKLNGGKMFGHKPRLMALRDDFHDQVASRYGLKKAPARLTGAAKSVVSSMVLGKLNDAADPALKSGIWLTIRDAIEADPTRFAHAMGLQIPAPSRSTKTMAQIFTSKGKGPSFQPTTINIGDVESDRSICSVDFQISPLQTSQPTQPLQDNVCGAEVGLFDPETGEYYDSPEPKKPTGAAG